MKRVIDWLCARISMLVLLLVITPFCVPIDRGASRTTVVLDAEYAGSRDYRESSGCDGPTQSWEQSHEQFGGRASVRWEERQGMIAGVDLAVTRGTLESAQTTTAETPRVDAYTYVAVGGELGFDRRHFGASFRPGLVVAKHSDPLPALNAEFRFGDLTTAWVELGGGTPRSPFDSRAFYIGPGFRAGPVRGKAGAAFLVYVMNDVYADELIYGEDSRWGGYVDLEWRFHERVGLRLGGIISNTPSARSGILIDF